MAASRANIISRASVKVIAESVGISQLKDEVADALAPDVEYRLRDIIFEAIKFQKHGRRDTLTTEDINYALRLRNSEPLYGFTSSDPPRFCRALTPGVFYLEDPELNLSHMLEEPLPRAPLEPTFTTHWLAVHGVQPSMPQNPTPEEVAAASALRKRPREADGAEGGVAAEGTVGGVSLARHALTSEEQTWLDRVAGAVHSQAPSGDEALIDPEASRTLTAVLRCVANDLSTQPLSAHLCALVAGEVNASLRCLPRLIATMRLLSAMLRSASIDLEPYLHQVRDRERILALGLPKLASPILLRLTPLPPPPTLSTSSPRTSLLVPSTRSCRLCSRASWASVSVPRLSRITGACAATQLSCSLRCFIASASSTRTYSRASRRPSSRPSMTNESPSPPIMAPCSVSPYLVTKSCMLS